MKYLVPDHLGLRWSDLLQPFARIDFNEDRPRFLAYLVTLVDYHLKLISYEHFILFPPFSINWFFSLGVAPFLLFRAVRNLGMSVDGAMAALIVYMTSTGFLFDFSMILFPAKAMTNGLFILSLYLVSRLVLSNKEGLLLFETRSPLKFALFFTVLAGLFVDEGPFFLFIFLPVLFRELFILPSLKPADLQRMAKNAFYFLAPLVIFLFLVVWIVPMITRHAFDYSFDYIGTILVTRKEQLAVGKSFLSREGEGFSLQSFYDNLLTMFGGSLVPWQVSPFLLHKATAGVVSSQAHNKAQILLLLSAFTGAAVLLFRAKSGTKKYAVRLAVVCALYVLFMSVLNGRHIIYMTGYYYGCTFSVFFAVLAAFCFEELVRGRGLSKFFSLALIFSLVFIQLNNFTLINRSYIHFHNESWMKGSFERTFPIADEKPLTRAELHEIWSAWKEGRIGDYLRSHRVSSGAVFLLAELRHRDMISQHP